MQLDEYQGRAQSTAVYPRSIALLYVALKLAGEAGEVSEKVGKALRKETLYITEYGDLSDVTEDLRRELAKEVGDVLWYVAAIASELGYTLDQIAQMNLDKLQSRSLRNVLIGEGDNR